MRGWTDASPPHPGALVLGDDAVAFLRSAPEGPRVVVRHRLDDGQATDAYGTLPPAEPGSDDDWPDEASAR